MKTADLIKVVLPFAPNVLNRQFNPDDVNKAWTSDLTYVCTQA
jgi:transposase InsO family protein